MSRAQFRDTVQLRSSSGLVVLPPAGASAALYDVGTSTLISDTIYADNSSSITLSNPLTLGADGLINIWTITERELDVVVSAAGYSTVRTTVTTDAATTGTGGQGPEGPQGPTGPPGPTGPTGSTGPSGPAGPVGPAGPSGGPGPPGATGATGAQGPQGVQGPTGPTGPQGSTGTGVLMKGTVPTVGNLPPSGNTQGDAYIVSADNSLWIWDGTKWVSGGSIQGPPGATGPQGVQGPTGATGPTGPQGVQGASGATGPPGTIGPTGPAGPQGTTGPTGPAGAQGVQGPAGPAGATGATGTTGPAGPTGATGATGPAGPGVPPGGTTGQVLAKTSATDYATNWVNQTGGAGGAASISVYEALAVTGSTVTLPSAPIASGMVGVYVNGQALMATRDYALAGNVITFTPALTADDVHVEYQTGGLTAAGYSGHYETTLSVGQSVITLPGTPSGVPLVHRGGVAQYQSAGHYSLAGSTLTLAVPISASEDGRISVDYVAGASTTPVNTTNLLVNGGFEVWQRGNGPFTASAAWTADQWNIGLAGTDTMSVTADNTHTDASKYCAAIAFTLGTGAGVTTINQKVEGLPQLLGRQVTLSCRVSAGGAGRVRLAIADSVNSWRYGTANVQSSGYETLTFTVTIPSNAIWFYVGVSFLASGTIYLDNAMLVTGGIAADYIPMHPADELARCMRYYEKFGPAGSYPEVIGYASAAGNNVGQSFPFRAVKPVSPTITVSSGWYFNNCSGISSAGPSLDGMYLQLNASGAGLIIAASNNAAYITVEANP